MRASAFTVWNKRRHAKAAVTRRNLCNGVAKQVSGGIAPCNMVSFVNLFRFSVARQVSQKVEPLYTSATVAAIVVVTPPRGTGLARSCYVTLRKQIRNRLGRVNNISRPVSTFPNEFRPFMLHSATLAQTFFFFEAPLHLSFS